MEFLTTLITNVPDGTADVVVMTPDHGKRSGPQYLPSKVTSSSCGGLRSSRASGERLASGGQTVRQD